MNKSLGLFFLLMFVIGTDTFLISPLLPTLRDEYGISTELSGWLGGAYPLGYALFALFAGPLSDRWNRKKVMVWGLLAFSLSTALCGLAPNFAAMYIFRFLAGVSAAFTTPQVWASIPVILPPQQMLKGMGIATAGLSVSQLFGVPLGSYLAAWDWSLPFYMIAGSALLLAVLIALVLPDLKPSTQGGATSILGRYRDLFEHPLAKRSFLAYFIFQTGNYAVFTFIGTWLARDFGLSVSAIGTVILFIGLGNTIGSFTGAPIVQKIGPSRALLVGLGINATLFLLLPHAGQIGLASAIFFLIFLIGGMIFPVMMGSLQGLSVTGRGTVAALSSSAMYAGSTLGSLIAGFLFANVGGFASVTLFTVITFVTAILLFRQTVRVQLQPVREKSLGAR